MARIVAAVASDGPAVDAVRPIPWIPWTPYVFQEGDQRSVSGRPDPPAHAGLLCSAKAGLSPTPQPDHAQSRCASGRSAGAQRRIPMAFLDPRRNASGEYQNHRPTEQRSDRPTGQLADCKRIITYPWPGLPGRRSTGRMPCASVPPRPRQPTPLSMQGRQRPGRRLGGIVCGSCGSLARVGTMSGPLPNVHRDSGFGLWPTRWRSRFGSDSLVCGPMAMPASCRSGRRRSSGRPGRRRAS
jgi:hypothetical protein